MDTKHCLGTPRTRLPSLPKPAQLGSSLRDARGMVRPAMSLDPAADLLELLEHVRHVDRTELHVTRLANPGLVAVPVVEMPLATAATNRQHRPCSSKQPSAA